MKVIFLDIDGVLNSSDSCFVKIGARQTSNDYAVDDSIRCVDAVCVAMLNRLIADTGAVLVLSSSHRSFFPQCVYGSTLHLAALQRYLHTLGVQGELLDVTTKQWASRGNQVQEWLDDHPEVTHHVSLDDSDEFSDEQHLVLCNPHHGFGFKEYQQACLLLDFQTSVLIY